MADREEEPTEGPADPVENLISAITDRNVDEVRHLLESGEVHLNDPNNTAFCIACQENRVEIVRMLMKHGVDVNNSPTMLTQYEAFDTAAVMKPIHCACNGREDRTELVQCLIDAGCSIDVGDQWKSTPLQFACHSENIPLVKLLLRAGANVDTENCVDETPLMDAASRSNVELIRILLDAGASPVANGSLAAFRCIQFNCPEGMELLYKASTHPVCDFNATMPRMKLMRYNRRELHDLELELELPDYSIRIPPLHMACGSSYGDHWKVVQALLEQGADIREEDEYGSNCLQYACSRVNINCIRVLLDHGANPVTHGWDKLWSAFPLVNPNNADRYLTLLRLLVFSGFTMDQESAKVFKETVEVIEDLPEEYVQRFLAFLATHRTVPKSLINIARMKIRQCIRPRLDYHIGKLDTMPHILRDELKFLNFLKPLA